MTRAYDEMYLDDAMENLGDAFDYAANECGMDLDDFFDKFLASGIADQFGKGVPKYVAGHSGIELVMECMGDSDYSSFPEADIKYDRSAEYWCGWVLAYYQWHTGRSFADIRRIISMNEILRLYSTLHEADERKFVDVMEGRVKRIKQ